MQLTTIYHASTTNSPRFYHHENAKNRKTPFKNHHPSRRFFSRKTRKIERWELAGKTLWTASKAMI
jgi:hypothetical protein